MGRWGGGEVGRRGGGDEGRRGGGEEGRRGGGEEGRRGGGEEVIGVCTVHRLCVIKCRVACASPPLNCSKDVAIDIDARRLLRWTCESVNITININILN